MRAHLPAWLLFYRRYKFPACRVDALSAPFLLLGVNAEVFLPDNLETVFSSRGCASDVRVSSGQWKLSMTVRTTRSTISFSHPFKLGDLDDIQPPGDYLLDTDEELIEGLSRLVYRRIATLLHLPAISRPQGRIELVAISPAELDAALERDRIGGA